MSAGDPGQVPITKVGGVPWWPSGVDRPQCEHRHKMTFMMQISIQDVPGLPKGASGLLSFHYCMECSYEGRTSFGCHDPGKDKSYDVRIFMRNTLESSTIDKKGIVSKEILTSSAVDFHDGDEIPELLSDFRSEFEAILPDDYLQLDDDFDEHVCPGLIHVPRIKLGGWPSWVQDSEWPMSGDKKMDFVGQIDWQIGESAPWANGGYAYLFAHFGNDQPHVGELVIQTS